MWNSVTLKRSLLQISNARSTTGLCRSLSQVATQWEGSAADISSDESTTNNNNNSHNKNNNGIIRFTMTPKPQNSSFSRGYGTSNHESINEFYEPQLDASEDPFFDRSAAAEQMAQQMQDSYYYASFKATSEEQVTSSKNL